jgi:nitroreductase
MLNFRLTQPSQFAAILTFGKASSSSGKDLQATAHSMSPALLNDTSSPLSLLATRKSASVKAMEGPGPTEQELQHILAIAVRAPDHGKLTPWRFIVIDGAARVEFGAVLARRWQELHPGHGEESLAFQRGLPLRAPLMLALVSRAAPHPKIPEWEQQLSAGAVGQNILLAAAAIGIGCQWNTDWFAYDGSIAAALGLDCHERIAGFFYFGRPREPLEDRPRPDPTHLLTRWGG